jgi:hypothetical protein
VPSGEKWWFTAPAGVYSNDCRLQSIVYRDKNNLLQCFEPKHEPEQMPLPFPLPQDARYDHWM